MKNFTAKASLILVFLVVIGSFATAPLMGADNQSPAPAPDNWCYSLIPGPTVNLNPSTQWFLIHDQFHAITLDNGQIVICTPDSDSNWSETQRLSIPDTTFTALKVKDINNDKVPELIAGTAEPGFIRIYRQNDGKWITNSNEKYVWTAITNVVAGNFDDPEMNNVLVQNQRGMLFLLKITGNDNALDLVWQSPSVWRAADSFLNLDFDQDGKDEIMVSYKAGGIGVLKAVNKQIVSVWDNYLWGKILDTATGDWDDDGKPELFLSTSQKIIYILGYNKTYQFEGQLSKLNYTTEKISFTNYGSKKQLFTTDTAGRLHLLEYYPKEREWVEQLVCPTGRVAQVLGLNTDQNVSILLWGLNRKMLTVQAMKSKELTLKYQNTDYKLTPPAWYQNKQLYLAPKALLNIPGFGLTYSADKSTFRVARKETKVAIKKGKDNLIIQTGAEQLRNEDCLLVNRELYISISGLVDLFGVTIQWEPVERAVQLSESPEVTPEEEVPFEETSQEVSPKEKVAEPTGVGEIIVTPTGTPTSRPTSTLTPAPTATPAVIPTEAPTITPEVSPLVSFYKF